MRAVSEVLFFFLCPIISRLFLVSSENINYHQTSSLFDLTFSLTFRQIISSSILDSPPHLSLVLTFCRGLFPKLFSFPISPSGFGGASPPPSPRGAAVSQRGSSPEHRHAQTAVGTRAANTPLWTGGWGQSHAGWALSSVCLSVSECVCSFINHTAITKILVLLKVRTFLWSVVGLNKLKD